MERGNDNHGHADTNHQDGSRISSSALAGAVPLAAAGEQGAGDNAAVVADDAGSEQIEPFSNKIPVFLDRTFRMIESISNDIVCWSEAGDSFIVKQAREREKQRRGGNLEEQCVRLAENLRMHHVEPISNICMPAFLSGLFSRVRGE